MTTRKYYPEVDARGRIIPEAANGRGVAGRLGAARDREFARLGRILEATRDLEGLRALNNLRELVEIPVQMGPAARGPSAFGPGVVDYLTLPDPRAGNQGARSGGVGSLDWRQFGEGGQQDSMYTLGVGRSGLLSDGFEDAQTPAADAPPDEQTRFNNALALGLALFFRPRAAPSPPIDAEGDTTEAEPTTDGESMAEVLAEIARESAERVRAEEAALEAISDEDMADMDEDRARDIERLRPPDDGHQMWLLLQELRRRAAEAERPAPSRTPVNPDDAGPIDYTGLAGRLISNVKAAHWRPAGRDPSSPGGRPPTTEAPSVSAPRLRVSGLVGGPQPGLVGLERGSRTPRWSIGPGKRPLW